MDYPCKDCTERTVGCHGSCEKYLTFSDARSQKWVSEWEQRRGDNLMNAYKRKVMQNMRRRMERGK